MEKEPANPNFYDISQERKSLREALKESGDLGVPEIITLKTKTELKAVQEEAGKFSIEKAGGLSKAKELLIKEKEEAEKSKYSKWIDEAAILKEIGADYEVLSKSQDEFSAISGFEISQLQKAQFNPYAKKSYENIREEILKEKAALAEKIKNIET
ncbi:MAG: hypothetical protein AAB851_02975, partial [Patescibacteria group bacterium]